MSIGYIIYNIYLFLVEFFYSTTVYLLINFQKAYKKVSFWLTENFKFDSLTKNQQGEIK